MIQNLAKNNPNIANAMPIVQQIMNSGKSKKEQLAEACKKSGVDQNQVEQVLNNLGIKL